MAALTERQKEKGELKGNTITCKREREREKEKRDERSSRLEQERELEETRMLVKIGGIKGNTIWKYNLVDQIYNISIFKPFLRIESK